MANTSETSTALTAAEAAQQGLLIAPPAGVWQHGEPPRDGRSYIGWIEAYSDDGRMAFVSWEVADGGQWWDQSSWHPLRRGDRNLQDERITDWMRVEPPR